MNRVSILSTTEYNPALLDSAVEQHIRLLGLDRLLRPGLRVTLKPNLLLRRSPEEATTTHPELVAAVVRALKRRGVTRITIADSPGGPYLPSLLAGIYKASGMAAVAEAEGIACNLEIGWREVPAQNARQVSSFNLIDPVADADLVINLCKLKTHCMTGLSGAVKNLFGCVPGLQKPEFHYRFKNPEEFCGMLVDLCETVRPAVTFVDAVVAMEGDGPSGGSPRPVGLTLCAENPYALDVALCHLIGMPEERALTVKAARARGLAPALSELELVGEPERLAPVEGFRMPAVKSVDFNTRLPRFIRRPADWFASRFLTPRPAIRTAGCIGCGKCAESCPAHTIAVSGGKAHIDYTNCIRCYCCHEMCPVKAIDIRRSGLFYH